MDIDRLPARDEGVDRPVIDQNQLDIAGFQFARLDQRGGHVVEQGLGLGIAQDRLRRHRLQNDQRAGQQRKRIGNKGAEAAHCTTSTAIPHELKLKRAGGLPRPGPNRSASWRRVPAAAASSRSSPSTATLPAASRRTITSANSGPSPASASSESASNARSFFASPARRPCSSAIALPCSSRRRRRSALTTPFNPPSASPRKRDRLPRSSPIRWAWFSTAAYSVRRVLS